MLCRLVHLWNPSLERVLLQACSFRLFCLLLQCSLRFLPEQAGEHLRFLFQIGNAMFPGADHLEMMIIAVSAVLAGAVCGDHISPISDTTVMSSAGAQSNHINHVTTQMQYAAVVAVVCIIGYIIAGLVQIWWVALGTASCSCLLFLPL